MARASPEIAAVLDGVGLGHLAERFAAEDIDAALLWSLRDDDLKELGLTLGQRRRLLDRLAHGRDPDRLVPDAAPPDPAGAFDARRLTVLFCDLVGFTELSARRDPDDVHALLQGYYAAALRAAERHGGILASQQGDGLIILFGYPTNRGGNAERAIGTALALLDEIAGWSPRLPGGEETRVAVRIGIASGKAVVGRPEGARAGEGLHLVGTAVNRAARLQAAARPGTVIVDQATQALVRGGFVLRRLPDARLKGFEEAVAVWQAEPAARALPAGPERTAQPLPRSAPRPETEVLAATWRTACAQRTAFVRLSGDAGIGKSTLLDELAATAACEGARVVRLDCSAVATHMPLWPAINLLERLLAQPPDAGSEARRAALQALLSGQSAEEVEDIAVLLGIIPQPRGDHATAAERGKRLIGALARHLVGEGGRPSLILVEDIHWADASTRALIGRCAEVAPDRGVMMVVSSRAADEPVLSGDARARDLPVAPLDEDAARDLLARHLAERTLPQSVEETILARSGGNPLMLDALARSVEGRAATGLDDEDFEVPATIYESISSRLDDLRAGRAVVSALAVFDEPTDVGTLALALGVAPADLGPALAELDEAGIVGGTGDGSMRMLRFRHSLYREVSYERLVKSARMRLHAAVFDALMQSRPEIDTRQPGLLAWHAAEAGNHAAAAPFAVAAAEQALAKSALVEAGHFLRQALAALDGLPQSRETDLLRLRALVGQASIGRAMRGIASDEAGELGRRVLDLARKLEDRRTELIALVGLYAHALVRAEYPAARSFAVRLREAAELSQDRTLQIIGDRGLGVVAFHTGSLDEAAVTLRRALASYDEATHLPLAHVHGYDHAEICAVFLSFTLWLMGDPLEAARVSAFSVSHARRIDHAHSLAQALSFRAMLATLARDLGTAQDCAREAVEVGARHGLAAMHGVGLFFASATALLAKSGPTTGAELDNLEDRYAHLLRVNPYNYGPLVGTIRALIHLECGQIGAARAALEGAERAQERTGETWTAPELLRVRARLEAAQGDRAAAARSLARAFAAAEHGGARMLALRIACDMAESDTSPAAFARLRAVRDGLISADAGWDLSRCQALLARAPVG